MPTFFANDSTQLSVGMGRPEPAGSSGAMWQPLFKSALQVKSKKRHAFSESTLFGGNSLSVMQANPARCKIMSGSTGSEYASGESASPSTFVGSTQKPPIFASAGSARPGD
jgi:hypothetical protein